MAVAVQKVKQKTFDKAARNTLFAILGGLLFIALKSVEYYEKIQHGLVMGKNTFFTFYWLLTGFHVIHVLIGLGILTFLYRSMKNASSDILDVESRRFILAYVRFDLAALVPLVLY